MLPLIIMDEQTKLHYQGCLATPPMWQQLFGFPYEQIDLGSALPPPAKNVKFGSARLGKLAEAIIFHQLKNRADISWIVDNLQVQDEKRTVGELDALFYRDGQPVHLEVAYKFYLWDNLEKYNQPLGYWIGPNRNDSLLEKLKKLRTRQFPLLHHELMAPYLSKHQLCAEHISQEICLKGQLFLPFGMKRSDITPLNPDCVTGYYFSHHDLRKWSDSQFYVPHKLDWLIEPHDRVDWINYPKLSQSIQKPLAQSRSPMVWIKQPDEEIRKCFITFWQ